MTTPMRRAMHAQRRFVRNNSSGVTLVELMISMTVGMFVVLAATALLVSSKSVYLAQSDHAQLQDTGRFAIESIGRAVRQSAYANWDRMEGPIVSGKSVGAAIFGMDATSLKSTSVGVDTPARESVNGSDVLAIRFHGAGGGANGDGTMLNCAGFGVGTPPVETVTDEDRGWSVFYVAKDSTGEPELYCKYRGESSWTSQAIARGVESFQVLYGLDEDKDGIPNHFLNASGVVDWQKVVAVRISLLVRGMQVVKDWQPGTSYDLFGKDYADANSVADPGVRIRESDLPKEVRRRERRIFTSTVQVRSRPVGMSG